MTKKDQNKDALSGVLDHIEAKIDELYALRLETQKGGVAEAKQSKVDLKEIYNHSTAHFHKQVDLLTQQLAVLKTAEAQWRELVSDFKQDNAQLTQSL